MYKYSVAIRPIVVMTRRRSDSFTFYTLVKTILTHLLLATCVCCISTVDALLYMEILLRLLPTNVC